MLKIKLTNLYKNSYTKKDPHEFTYGSIGLMNFLTRHAWIVFIIRWDVIICKILCCFRVRCKLHPFEGIGKAIVGINNSNLLSYLHRNSSFLLLIKIVWRNFLLVKFLIALGIVFLQFSAYTDF